MKGRAIAAALAALTIFGAAPSVSARHLAEEYIERVHRERRERMEEEMRDARLREQAETRRRAAEERERREAERRAAEEMEDDEDFDEEPEEEEPGQARRETEVRAAEERRRIEAQEEEALRERQRQAEETEKRQRAEAEQKAAEEAKRAAEAKRETATTTEEADATTGESFLQQLLRRARERTQGIMTAADEKPSLHVAKEQPMKLLKAETVDAGGTLIFSDSPEYVKQPGILYTDVVKGDARVFYYHLNDTKKKYKVAVVLESVDGQYAVVRVTRRATAAPSEDYFKVGKGLQQAFFSDERGTEKCTSPRKSGVCYWRKWTRRY